MAKMKTICHICNASSKDETVPELCPRCGANLADPQQEQVLKQTGCQYSQHRNMPGNLGAIYLTNQRLLCVNEATALSYGGGLIGAAIAMRQKWGLSIPLDNIQAYEDAKFGFFGTAFIITLTDGSIVKMNAKPKEEWIKAITEAKEQLIANRR